MNDYRMFTVTSLPDSSGQFDVKDIRRDLSSLVNNAIKSALPENAYFKVGEKQLAPNGQMSVNVYVHKDQAYLAETSARQQMEAYTFKGGISPRYSVSGNQDVDDNIAKELITDEKQMNKEKREDIRFNRGTLLKVTAVLTAIADITRRILSSVINMSQQTAKDMVTANNLGMSYESVRQARHIETAHGMKEGTIVGGITDIQKMFGNITALDEKSLEALAVVMGGEIKEAIDMGLGASNPEKVLGMILDKFNAQANAGYNSIGQQVGEQQARRELYSYLLKVSPQIADIFATMQEEQHNINSIFKDGFGNFDEWRKLVPTERGEPTATQRNMLAVTSQEWNLAKEAINQIKEALLISLIPAVLKIARFISNLRIGMSEAEKERLNADNYAKNEAFIRASNKTINLMEHNEKNLSPEQRARLSVLKEVRDRAIKENESEDNIADVSYTDLELQYATEAEIKRQAKAKAFNAKYALSTLDPDKVYTEEELIALQQIPDVSSDDIASTLRGYPAKEKELRGKYSTAQKDFENQAIESRKQDIEALKKSKRSQIESELDRGIGYDILDDTKIEKEVGTHNPMLIANLRALLLASKLSGIDLFHDEKGKPLSFKGAVKKAKKAKLIEENKLGAYSVVAEAQLSAEELDQIRQDNPTDYPMDFYTFAYSVEPVLFNKSAMDKKSRKSQKASLLDPYQEFYKIFYKWGDNLEKLAYLLPAGTYAGEATNIRSVETNENGIYTHKIICDITANGKTLVKDFVLDTGTNITGGFTGTHVQTLKINAFGDAPSEILAVQEND